MANSSVIFLPFFSFLILAPLILASPSSSDRPQTFIVHVSRSHKPVLFNSHHDWYSSIIRSLPPPHHQSKLLYTYSKAINGFSAQLTPLQAEVLRRQHAGILSVIPDLPRQLHTTHTPGFLGLSDNFGIWPDSSYADDVIVGVLDTGIWPERDSFSDSFLSDVPGRFKGVCETSKDFPASACNKKIIGARAFYKGYESNLGRPIDETEESKSPRDTNGHGTHTASTAAGSLVKNASFLHYASGEARGIAVKARISVYKICWDAGCFDSDILAAMDQAVADGIDVISLSVGTSYALPYHLDSIAIGSFGAAQHGVVVSCSAGNSGPAPSTATNIAPWILTVGASTVDREFPADVILGDGRIFGGVSLYAGESLPDVKLPLVLGADCGSRYCYMGGLEPSKVQGKIVVCERGGNARVQKGAAVKLAGGLGMIMANPDENGEELLADPHLIAATMVGANAVNKIREYIQLSQYPTATIVFHGTVIGPSPPSPQVASFSSRGPNSLTPEILKPDVIAPGVNILAGWTGFTGPTGLEIDPRRVDFNIISGTSMACPHVSGLVALLRRAFPDWSPAAIKSALMTTAYNLDNSGQSLRDLTSGKESNPFIHGAGHVDPNGALNPGLVYDIDASEYVGFLCSIGYDAKKISVFVREPVTSDICAINTLDAPGNLNYPSFSVTFDSATDVVKYKRVVKNVGGSVDGVYEVKVNAPPNVAVDVRPSKLPFSAQNKTMAYEITFSSSVSGGLALEGVGVGVGTQQQQQFGSIEWSDGVHLVRSPIAVRWIQGSSMSSSL